MGKSFVFTPGCKYTFVKEGDHNLSGHVIMFVEYETVSGEHKRQRFDLVDPSVHFVIDGHRQAQLSYISNPPEGVKLDIKKVRYREESCWTIIGGKMFIPTRIEFDTVIHVPKESPDVDSDRVKMINQRIARIAANSAYGLTSRDWADVLADSARYIHMQQSRCNGKTLWLSSATSFADKQPLWNISNYHDICEQWLKEPPTPYEFIADDLEDCEKGVPNTKLIDPNGYFDTDMAMRYCRNDVAVTEKIFKEEINMAEKTRFDMYKPTVKKVIFSEPATIVFWTDNTKTIVKCGENDIYDPEKGVAMCCMKKLLGTNKTGSNYLDNNETLRGVKRHIQKWEEDNRKEAKSMEESIEKEFEAVTSDDWEIVPADENTTAEENGE